MNSVGEAVTEPGAVATGSYIQPAIDNFALRRPVVVECWDPVATALGSVTNA